MLGTVAHTCLMLALILFASICPSKRRAEDICLLCWEFFLLLGANFRVNTETIKNISQHTTNNVYVLSTFTLELYIFSFKSNSAWVVLYGRDWPKSRVFFLSHPNWDGVWESQFGRGDRNCGTLGKYLVCAINWVCRYRYCSNFQHVVAAQAEIPNGN